MLGSLDPELKAEFQDFNFPLTPGPLILFGARHNSTVVCHGEGFFSAFSTKAVAESRDVDHFIYNPHSLLQK